MSPFYSSKFGRKSSSASTSKPMDEHTLGLPDTAPLSPSLPLLAPLRLTRRDEWNDELREVTYCQQSNAETATRPWSHHLPYMRPSLPSLMTKFAAHAPRSDASLSYSPSPLSCTFQTTHLFPQGDSAITDDGEEYDLESMDIHIRETYFATSAERGRWLSSPVAPRVRSKATQPMRGHSSPIRTLVDASPLRGRTRRHQTTSPVDEQVLASSSEDHEEDMRCLSPLPPSSPMISPMSNLTFLSDCEGDSTVGPRLHSDDHHSLPGTPELSISSTACTSPVEPTRMPTPHEPMPHDLTSLSCHPARSTSPHSTNPQPPLSIGVDVHGAGANDFNSENILSPLSQFGLDLPDAEPQKLPLSDTVNKPHPGQCSVNPGANLETPQSQDGTPTIQSLSVNSNHEPPDSFVPSKKVRKRGVAADAPGASRTKKRADTRSGGSSSRAEKRRGTESRTSNCSEPPSKKSKPSRCKDDSGTREVSLQTRGEPSKIKRSSRPFLRPFEDCSPVSSYPHDRKTSRTTRCAQLQQRASSPVTAPALTHPAGTEFYAALTGMLIETLATSRATSMDTSTLHLVLTQAHPQITTERSREELLTDIATVLEAGRTRCGMFGKVDCSGERLRHKTLESRWFYVPERDEDRERASLVSSIMPRQKRNETKKYKQYYYRPLDKMSRWDPEDAP